MNKKDILRMARETQPENEDLFIIFCYNNTLEQLTAFAALIAEDCAKRCEQLFDPDDDSCSEAETCAAAIREAYKP